MRDQNGLCPCESGLRALRCCQSDPAQWPGEAALALLAPKAEEATKLFNEKKYEEAEALALAVLDAAPNQRIALRVLFEIRNAQKRGKAADALGARLAGLPGNAAQRAQANGHYAQYLIGQARYEVAIPFAAEVLKATPRAAQAHHVMGVAFTETGALEAGELSLIHI